MLTAVDKETHCVPARIALHRFESDPSLPQRDGVNLAHTEINRLLGSVPPAEIRPEFHDFDRLLRDSGYARRVLDGVDCVLCNVGPHAHYYHAIRERLGLRFRIVRDIKTALWSSYLLQESLCAPFLRPGDTLLATSRYSRVLVRKLFPHLVAHPIHLFEPVLASIPEPTSRARKTALGKDFITLGHIGRLSEDKNVPQMVDLLIALNRIQPGRYRLVACGAVHSTSCDPSQFARRIREATGRADLFTYLPPVAHEDVVGLLRSFDYFLFFSTSNLEVLGRVLVEAAHAQIPVVAANHAAAPELVDQGSLIEVDYTFDRPFHTHFDAPMGSIDVNEAAAKILSGNFLPPPIRGTVNRLETLLDILNDRAIDETAFGEEALSRGPADFLERLECTDLPCWQSRSGALRVIAELQEWFCALNGKASGDFAGRLRELARRSPFPERTRRFLAITRSSRCDFTNLGGIDIELCNVIGYHPRCWLNRNLEQGARRPPLPPVGRRCSI